MAVRREERSGWTAVVVEGGDLQVTVLPGKGGDLYELVHRRTGVDVLFKAPWGLAPPGAAPRAGSDGHAFLDNYEGGWQTLLPNTNDPCTYGGVELPFHGEVCALPWTWSALGEHGLRLSVECLLLPLRLEGSPCLVFHHCMDICASISSIFFSVVARSSGLDGMELWKNEGRAAGSWPAMTSLRRILRSMSNSRLRTKSLRRLRSIISLSICLE